MKYEMFDGIYLKEITEEEFKALSSKEITTFTDLLQSLANDGDKVLKQKVERIKQSFRSAARTFGLFDGDKYIGYVSFSGYKTTTPEIQIDIHEPYQRKGIGYKAVTILTEMLFQERADIEYFIYRVRTENLASKKLIEKLSGKEVPIDPLYANFIRKFIIERKTA